MEDLFSDIPALDISILTKKSNGKSTEVETPNTTVTGHFNVGDNDTPEIPEKEEVEVPEKVGTVEKKVELVDDTPEVEEVAEVTETEESPVKMISSFLKEKGVIDFTDEDFKDEDDFIANQVSKQITTGVQAYKDTLPDEIKQLIDNYEEGVPLGQLLEHEQKTFELTSITNEKLKEDSRLQEDIVESYMLNTGWTKAETDERIKELQDAGIMEKEAVRSLTKLIQLEKATKEDSIKQVQEKRKAETAKYQEQINHLQTTIKDTKEFFDGVPTNDAEKKVIFEAITKYDKQGRNKISQLLNDPKTYIKTAYFLEVLKGDITKLKTVAKTAAIKETKKTLDTPVKTESRFGGKNLSIIQNFLKTKNN